MRFFPTHWWLTTRRRLASGLLLLAVSIMLPVLAALGHGAEAIVVACPMCQSNLDMRRPEINAALAADHQVPVIFITQALGLAMGLDPVALGLQRHLVPALALQPAASGKA